MLVVVILVIVFWPTPSPFAGIDTVAVQSPNWGQAPKGEVIKGPFIEGLEVTLGEENITIVGNLDEADALLAITEIKTGKIEVRLEEGQITGLITATCILTNLDNGKYYTLDFYLTFGDGEPRSRLKVRRFWEFWK